MKSIQSNIRDIMERQLDHSSKISSILNHLTNASTSTVNSQLIHINQDVIVDEDGFVPLFCNNKISSHIMIKQSIIKKVISKSCSRSMYAIRMIPYVFSFINLYRHQLRDQYSCSKLPLDEEKVNALILSALQYIEECNHDASKIRRNISNHISNLNSLFSKLKLLPDGQKYVITSKKDKLTKSHVYTLCGISNYINKKINFFLLDTAIKDYKDNKFETLVRAMRFHGLNISQADLEDDD